MAGLWLASVMFLLGLVLTVKGGDLFVDAACWMAAASGMPQFLIGATVVSLATTLPELLVSTMAAAQGQSELAIGNAVGSVTANTGLILALAMMFLPGRVRRRDCTAKAFLLITAILCLWLACRDGRLSGPGCLPLAVLLALAVAESLHAGRTSRGAAAQTDLPRPTRRDAAGHLFGFALGLAGILAGARLLVNSARALARGLGLPESLIAVTIVAIGTSLPELVTTLTAIFKRQSSLSAGNILGANLIDIALILPVCRLVNGGPLPMGAQTLTLDFPFCLGINLLALLPMLFTGRFARWQGAACLTAYAAYTLLLCRGAA